VRILILGAGIVGTTLAEQLSKEKHDIYVIERNPDLIRQLNDNLDIFAMLGSATSQDSLERVGVQDMDLVIAVTSNDEVNILGCLLAHQYGVPKLVARVRNPEFANEGSRLSKANVGIDQFINPTRIVVDTIERLIEVPGCTDVAYVGGKDMQIRGFEVTEQSSIAGKDIQQLRDILASDAFSILAITRKGKTVIPSGEETISPGDRIVVLVSSTTLNMFLPLLTPRLSPTKKVVIFGASLASIELAKSIEIKYPQVVIIEPNSDRCAELAKALKKTLIIQGSALDKGTLEEIVIETVDVFVALSERDEDNFMAAMMARQYGAKRTMVLTEKPTYLEIVGRSDIDLLVNPRIITVSKVLQFLRRGHVLSAAKLTEGDAEVLEYFIDDDSPLIGRTPQKLRDKKLLPKGASIAAIKQKDGLIIIPEPDSVIEAGHSVVVFSLPRALEKVQNLFSGRRWNFLKGS
jgi:trk system potassium uptake protein TrkA